MCGRYTLYTGAQAEEIRQIIDIAQRQAQDQLKLGEVFPSDRAPILVANQDKVVVRTAIWGFPGFQGKGIGSTVIRRCCSSGNEPIMLYGFIKNQRAISLYSKLGFEVVETVRDSRFIMKRDGRKSE